MSDNSFVQNSNSKGRKKKKTKRAASSPINDNESTGILNGGTFSSKQRKRRQGDKTSCVNSSTASTKQSDNINIR